MQQKRKKKILENNTPEIVEKFQHLTMEQYQHQFCQASSLPQTQGEFSQQNNGNNQSNEFQSTPLNISQQEDLSQKALVSSLNEIPLNSEEEEKFQTEFGDELSFLMESRMNVEEKQATFMPYIS